MPLEHPAKCENLFPKYFKDLLNLVQIFSILHPPEKRLFLSFRSAFCKGLRKMGG